MIPDAGEVYLYFFDRSKEYSTKDAMLICALDYCKSKKLFSDKGLDSSMIKINRSSSGKPYFENLPGVGVSVSHSGKHLVCAVANGEIGVDIEERGAYPLEREEDYEKRLEKIARRFFHPHEADLVTQDPTTRFYEVFTAKESFVKFTGTGFDETLGEISVLPEDKSLPSCHKSGESVSWSTKEASFRQEVFDVDYTLCICMKKAIDKVVKTVF